MENNMKAHILSVAVIVFLMQTLEAATIQTDPSYTRVNIGDAFTIDIVGLDFPETQGGGFTLIYDPNMLNVINVSIDEAQFWTFVNDNGVIDNESGVLSEVNVSEFPGIIGDFTIATIEFLAVGYGTSRFRLTESTGNPWASNGTEISPALMNDNLVQVVPIPAAVWLFGSGLLGLIGAFMRRTY
jgi:hypothetical protein